MDLREAANKLGVSESTIRRWIKSGRLQANKVNGPYGEQYDIDDEAIEAAKKFNKVPVIVRNDGILPQEVLMKVIQQSVNEVVVSTLNKVEQSIYFELEDLKRELEETRRQLAAEREKDRAWQEERDRQLMQAIREIQRRQEEKALPLWKKLFKR